MRPSMISLLVLALAAGPALAQTDTTAPAAPPAAAPAPTTAPASPPPAAAPAPTTAPASPSTAAPGAPVNPPAAGAPSASPTPEAAPEPPPPAPPGPPTDPTAIKLLSTLDQICIPAVEGGNLDKLAKSGGFRKNSDGNYVNKGAGFQLTLLAFGSNPDTCHVDIIAPVDPQAPARPLVVALHNWATSGHGFSLYRNDKNTQTGQEITTRSWELTDGGKYKALVLTTYRKADGTPAMGNRETSTMLYSEHAAAAPAS